MPPSLGWALQNASTLGIGLLLATLFGKMLTFAVSSASGFIGAAVEQFATHDWLWLALAPEGTRKHTDHIKSGFYQIAVRAGVPVGFGFIDYPSKTIGLGEFVRFSGDVEQDLELIRAFYADKRGKRPSEASELRFRKT